MVNATSDQAEWVAERTGLVLDPYFSAPKMSWLRSNVTTEGVVTTTDSWLIHQLCGEFVTDVATASRSLLTGLDSADWDPDLLKLFSWVVVGAEPVSWSAVLTLREAGCRTVLMTSEHASPESYAAFNLVGRLALRTPIATRTRVVNIVGKGRLEAVEVEDIDTLARRTIECDTIVFTGDWIPDNELARLAGIVMDPCTLGPAVDTALRTSRADVFAAGGARARRAALHVDLALRFSGRGPVAGAPAATAVDR